VISTRQTSTICSRCTLCPAMCELDIVATGPQAWRSEYPLTADGTGLCPRAAALVELLGHQRRILMPARRVDGKTQQEPGGLRQVEMKVALQSVIDAGGGGEIIILLDGNVPCEQILTAAAWCRAWPAAKLCLVIAPPDEQLLLGIESSGAEYLSGEAIEGCDGFLIIGDAFAANPTCSRAVFNRRKTEPKTPIVVIDPAAGTAAKFATHCLPVGPGGELSALAAVASAAGAKTDNLTAQPSTPMPSAVSAGQALANCRRLGVIIAAEYGRSAAWRQIGYVAGQLAGALGGAVAAQTVGANALAAVRLAAKLKTICLAEAVSRDAAIRVAVGCDVLGMLGWKDSKDIFAAAAPLSNCTTDAAQIVMPSALPGEYGGSYLGADGKSLVEVSPVLAAPMGVVSPAEIIAALAEAAGVPRPDLPVSVQSPERLDPEPPASLSKSAQTPSPVLLLARQATHAGAGELTGHGSWQATIQDVPELRVSPADARSMNLRNLAKVTVRANGRSLCARLRTAPELACGTIVLPEGFAGARSLVPGRVAAEAKTIVAGPVTAEVSR